jgi:hypothetical protein
MTEALNSSGVSIRSFLLSVVLACQVYGADCPTDVPDPFGLGERLALIDWLQGKAVSIPEGATLEQLRRLYQTAAHPDQDPALKAAALREELQRKLWTDYGIVPPPECSVEQLQDLIATAEQKKLAQEEKEKETEAADELKQPANVASPGAPSSLSGLQHRPSSSSNVPPAAPNTPATEPKFLDQGYSFAAVQDHVTLYIQPNQVADTLHVQVALWNDDDVPVQVEIQIYPSSGRPAKDTVNVPAKSSRFRSFSFPNQPLGSRAEGTILKTTESK